VEEYKYKIGESLAFEEQYFDGELFYMQGMSIEEMLEVFIIDMDDQMMNWN